MRNNGKWTAAYCPCCRHYNGEDHPCNHGDGGPDGCFEGDEFSPATLVEVERLTAINKDLGDALEMALCRVSDLHELHCGCKTGRGWEDCDCSLADDCNVIVAALKQAGR